MDFNFRVRVFEIAQRCFVCLCLSIRRWWTTIANGTKNHNRGYLATGTELWDTFIRHLNRKVTHENFDICFIFRDFSTNEPEGSYYHDNKITKEFEDLALDELEVIATLGMGGFGRVELVTTYTLYSLYLVVSRASFLFPQGKEIPWKQ